jgi:predicted Zn finger-like uncharacterized protein
MLTECPSCLTVFRVTGAILKMGHGQVRCGKCRTQFDALDSLLDDDTGDDVKITATQTTKAVDQAQQNAAIEAREPEIAEEITLEGSRIEISGTYRVAGNESTADSDHATDQIIHEHVVIDRDELRADSSIADTSLADSNDPDSLREVPDDEIIEINLDDGEPVADAAHHLMSDANPPDRESVPLSQRIWKRARPQQATKQNGATDEIVAELDALTQAPQPAVERAGWWTAISVALVFALIGQIVHHYRDPLVRSPKWGGTVSRLYRTLGINLAPQWDLHAYELQQWGVISDASARDALRVRASVTNTATFEQPYPLVRLALEDRWGSIVAMREFAPEEYLPSTATANRMMAPRQRANAEIVIVDPGADAVGFQIRACMPQGTGVICADDVPASR